MRREPRRLRGPNVHTSFPVIQLDIEDDRPVPMAPLVASLLRVLDHDRDASCRAQPATLPGAHATQHVARELLHAAGQQDPWGPETALGSGLRRIAVAYDEEDAGLLAVKLASELVEDAREGLPLDAQDAIARVRELRQECGPGPSTRSILDAGLCCGSNSA